MNRRESMEDRGAAADPLRAILVRGGAVVLDEDGLVSFGISDESFERLIEDAPDFLREAVAHLAAKRAPEAGLVESSRGVVDEPVARHDEAAAEEELVSPAIDPAVRLVRSRTFLGGVLYVEGIRAWEGGRAVLPIVESGSRAYLGPLLTRGRSPCIVCLRRAVAPNRQSEGLLGEERALHHRHLLPDSVALGLFRRASASTSDEIVEVDWEGRVVGRHHVRSNPDCPVCGRDGKGPEDTCPTLVARPKHVVTDTGARARAPRETLQAYRHLISPLTGAVRRIRRVRTTAPDLIHVYTASHAMTERARSFGAVMRDGRDHSGGKGSTADQARVSALCEALERFSAVASGGEVDVVARSDRLEDAMHPPDTMLFSQLQYAGREEWNGAQGRFQYVPERFDPAANIAWSRVWNLRTRTPAYAPTSLLYFAFDGPGSACCRADSNGLAAGETLEEAVLQGLLEVVERDAIAIWWYNRLRQPAVDVDSFDDAYVGEVFAHYETLGRNAWVLDLTSDLGIPVFAALSARTRDALPEVIFGFGAHLDPSIALRRCVTEMNQMLATVTRNPEKRAAQLSGEFDDALSWWSEATLDSSAYLLPDPQLAPRRKGWFGNASTNDLKDDIQTCLDVAGDHGLEVYVRNMTRADLGISVAKVLVPGLRHFWRRLAPGRLYDVPVRMGYVDAPLREEDMNPVSFFV